MENDCTPKCGDLSAPISASSVIYKGNILTCIGAEIPDTLESIVHKLDQAICDKLKDIGSLTELANTGGGIELYLGESNTGKKEIATLRSPDDSVSIVYNSETKEVDIEVDSPQIQSYIFSSDDRSVDITTNEEGNEVDFSINSPPPVTQVNSDVQENNPLSPAFIRNKNSSVVKFNNYVLTPSDNNRVLLLDTTIKSITISVPATLPDNNYFVGFIQKGTNIVQINNSDAIRPVGYTNVIEGEGHSAAIEIIGGEVFLLGSLKEDNSSL